MAPTLGCGWLTSVYILATISLAACLWPPAAGQTGRWPPPVFLGQGRTHRRTGLTGSPGDGSLQHPAGQEVGEGVQLQAVLQWTSLVQEHVPKIAPYAPYCSSSEGH